MTKLLTLFIFLSIVTYGQTSNEWKTFNQSNYSIQYPSDWVLNQERPMGISFVIFSPKESDKDNFSENVNLGIQDLAGKNIDLNKYTEVSEGQIKMLMTNSNLIESNRIKNGANEYHKIIYSGDQGIFKLKFEQYYWVINDKAYVLTFTAEQNKFANYKERGEKIMNSFLLKL